jgi:hypothetical protein
MGLIDDDIVERKCLESTLLDQANLVRRDGDIEILGNKPSRDHVCAFLFSTYEDDEADVRSPSLKLAGPVL